jgi:hypothetical protein
MQHDAAGAALDLGATFESYLSPPLVSLHNAASGAADAERSAANVTLSTKEMVK